MSSRLVDGVAIPDAVGGHPALDFCNTRAGWGAPAPREYLTSGRALGIWVRESGLVPPGAVGALVAEAGSMPGETVVLQRVHALREALYACLVADGSAQEWALLSREATAARAASCLVPVVPVAPGCAEGAVGHWLLDADAARGGPAEQADLALHAIAASAEGFITSALSGVVAACPGAGCGWLFADPRRRRRWCSMAVCGNRAKARRHIDRKRGESDQGAGVRTAQPSRE